MYSELKEIDGPIFYRDCFHVSGAKLFLVLLGFCFAPFAYTQTPYEILKKEIQKHTYQLKVNEGEVSGTGFYTIKEAIAGSQFLLVGEQHGIAEPALFTEALFREALKYEYRYLCIETDPFVAARLETLLRQSYDSTLDSIKDYPLSVPFYSTQEDIQLIKTVVELSPAAFPVLWGVDQVFMGASRLLFSRLAELAPDDRSRQVALNYYEKSLAAFTEVVQTRDFSKLILMQLKEDDFKKLYEAFGEDSTKETVRIIQSLQKSQSIYLLWFQGRQYENNLTRVSLIKKQFLEYYRQAMHGETLPRVVFRFGLTHTMRGLSMYDQFDLGNMAYELAGINEMKAVSFRITGIKGSAQGPMEPPSPFDNTDSIHPLILESISDHNPDLGWVLLDFRPLRLQAPNIINPIRELIHSYDFWILVPDAKPVTNL